MQSREPITYVEIEQDFCQLRYGVAPCMAAIGVTGNTQCFNTLRTCQDMDNYTRGSITLRFCNGEAPSGVQAIPSVTRVRTAPTVINPGGGGRRSGPLGQRASLSVTFQDHPSSDLQTDPYINERGYNPMATGTFWTKWLARNPYYNNRIVRVVDDLKAGEADINQAKGKISPWNDATISGDVVTVNGLRGGAQIARSAVQLGIYHALEFKIKKISGNVFRIGGHASIAILDDAKVYLDGALVAIELDGNGWYINYTNSTAEHTVRLEFITKTEWQSDSAIYIQPNRSDYNYQNVTEIYGIKLLTRAVTRTYLIDRIVGPNSRGEVTLQAKDILRLADNDKALAPHPSPGELVSDYDENASGNIDVTGATTADYPASGTIRINREVFRYTGRAMSGSVLRFTGITRATDGTEKGSHKAGDMVQECLRYEQVRVEQLARDWLVDYAGVPSEYIPYADWQAESDLWLDQFDFTGLITEPTGVNQLLGEICEQALFYIWWDERAQLIRLQAIAPRIYEDVETIDDDKNIVADSVEIKDDPASRVSQVWVFWGVRNATESLRRDDNYTRIRVRADLDAESKNQYDDSRIRKVYSRWIRTEGQAINLSTRILNKLRDNPRTMTIELDAKDRRFWTGDVVDVLTRYAVDFLGQPLADRWQVLSAEEIESGHRVRYELDLYEFGISGLHGRWMEVDAPSYNDATEVERLSGAWWADENGRIPTDDGDVDGYQWI